MAVSILVVLLVSTQGQDAPGPPLSWDGGVWRAATYRLASLRVLPAPHKGWTSWALSSTSGTGGPLRAGSRCPTLSPQVRARP